MLSGTIGDQVVTISQVLWPESITSRDDIKGFYILEVVSNCPVLRIRTSVECRFQIHGDEGPMQREQGVHELLLDPDSRISSVGI